MERSTASNASAWIVGALLVATAIGLGAVFLGSRALQEMDALDTIVPTEGQIRHFRLLAPFHVGLTRILPIRLNIDTNSLEYEYDTTYANATALFSISDEAATKAGWVLTERGSGTRRYLIIVPATAHDQVEEFVKLTFRPQLHRVLVEKTRGRWMPLPGTTGAGGRSPAAKP